jgi:geranylgeranyl pyrophosphate synthase
MIIATSDFEPELKNEVTYILSKAIVEVTEGQILDLSFEGRKNTTLKDILFMYEKKTGALFEACGLIGMVLSKGTKKQRQYISEWAKKYFNWRFQIHDDFIENNIDGVKGKPIGGDIKEGKVTPLVVETLEKGNRQHRKALLKAWGKGDKIGEEEIMSAIDAMFDSGAVDSLREFKNECGERGKELIEKVGFIKEYENLLKDLTEFVGARPY